MIFCSFHHFFNFCFTYSHAHSHSNFKIYTHKAQSHTHSLNFSTNTLSHSTHTHTHSLSTHTHTLSLYTHTHSLSLYTHTLSLYTHTHTHFLSAHTHTHTHTLSLSFYTHTHTHTFSLHTHTHTLQAICFEHYTVQERLEEFDKAPILKWWRRMKREAISKTERIEIYLFFLICVCFFFFLCYYFLFFVFFFLCLELLSHFLEISTFPASSFHISSFFHFLFNSYPSSLSIFSSSFCLCFLENPVIPYFDIAKDLILEHLLIGTPEVHAALEWLIADDKQNNYQGIYPLYQLDR